MPISSSTPTGKLARRNPGLELVIGLALFGAGIATLFYAFSEMRRGRAAADVVETLAFSVGLFGGCLDPVNTAVQIVPWVSGDVVEPTPYSHSRTFFFVPAFLMLVGSWVWRHWLA